MLSDTMYKTTTYIHAFRHLYIVHMHMLCKYYFVRIVVDLFVGPFNCLNFSLCACVCARVCVCARACVCVCARMHECVFVSFSLSYFFPNINIVHFCYVYKLFLLKTI